MLALAADRVLEFNSCLSLERDSLTEELKVFRPTPNISTRPIRKRYLVSCVAGCAQQTGMDRISHGRIAYSVGTV